MSSINVTVHENTGARQEGTSRSKSSTEPNSLKELEGERREGNALKIEVSISNDTTKTD
jgi:hypothetical protein